MNERATETNLNKEEFEQLRTAYVNTIVDSMSTKDLEVYVTNDMDNFVDELSNQDLIEEIKYTLDEAMLDEFVKQIRGKIV